MTTANVPANLSELTYEILARPWEDDTGGCPYFTCVRDANGSIDIVHCTHKYNVDEPEGNCYGRNCPSGRYNLAEQDAIEEAQACETQASEISKHLDYVLGMTKTLAEDLATDFVGPPIIFVEAAYSILSAATLDSEAFSKFLESGGPPDNWPLTPKEWISQPALAAGGRQLLVMLASSFLLASHVAINAVALRATSEAAALAATAAASEASAG